MENKPTYNTLECHMPSELYEKLKAFSKRNGMTIAQSCRFIIAKTMDKLDATPIGESY